MRVRMDVEYDGTNYCGWQRQDNGTSVQQVIEDAVEKLSGQRVAVHGAGRTDAGVHALCMTCHFDTGTSIPPERLGYALNFLLPEDVRVKETRRADESFHARFDARAKWYRYRILMHPQGSALFRRMCWHVPYGLDTKRMQSALPDLLGTHDYGAFEASGGSAKHTVRTVHRAQLTSSGDWLTLDIVGDAFLYNMVRIIAGTLVDIGRGKCDANAFARMIQTKDRLQGGVTAPAHGLMLMRVFYDEHGDIREKWAQMMDGKPW